MAPTPAAVAGIFTSRLSRATAAQAAGGGDGAGLVVGQRRGDFQAHVAGVALAGLEDRADDVAGALHVLDHQAFVARLGAEEASMAASAGR
jgi:hypothetical protein